MDYYVYYCFVPIEYETDTNTTLSRLLQFYIYFRENQPAEARYGDGRISPRNMYFILSLHVSAPNSTHTCSRLRCAGTGHGMACRRVAVSISQLNV